MIYVTGDTHGDFGRFNAKRFPQQKELTRDDYVIICGDFGGIWSMTPTPEERYTLSWLESKPFTVLFCDGNHENFDRLKRFPIVSFHGGKAHRICENVYHLMRGYVFNMDCTKFFVFGGAKSHDIQDGVLQPQDYDSLHDMVRDWRRLTQMGKIMRMNHVSWWSDELPKKREIDRAKRNLQKYDYNVDYIISHSTALCFEQLMYRDCEPNILNRFFDSILEHGICFKRWYCGHYHQDRDLNPKMHLIYHDIIPIPSVQQENANE